VAVHVFFIMIYPSLFPAIDPGSADLRVPLGTPVAEGLEVVQLVEIDVPDEVEEPDEPEFAAVEERRVESSRPAAGPTVIDLTRSGETAADRLRPRVTDSPVWELLPREFSELTLAQREELALSGRLQEWYDSVQAAADAASAMTDWTFTDGDGGRWGIADGQLFLGDFAIPVPVFAAPPGAARDAQSRYSELARQGQTQVIQGTVRERMQAIRARRDAERARERATQQGDTSSVRQ
jgi:hypothetical protein